MFNLFKSKLKFSLFSLLIFFYLGLPSFAQSIQDTSPSNTLTIGIDGKINTLDPIGSTTITSNDEQIRTLMFNSLVKQNERLEIVGELAKDINIKDDGKTIEFVLHENIKFHNGHILTSADVKYTLDALFESKSAKASAFYEISKGQKQSYIIGIEAANSQTVRLKLAKPSFKNQVLSNLVLVSIIPEKSKIGTEEASVNPPLGTGAYKFVKFDAQQSIVELTVNFDYWQGIPAIPKVYIKTIPDTKTLFAELKAQTIDLARITKSLSPEEISIIAKDPKLKIERFEGTNIQYLGFNVQAKPLDNVKIRQAIAYAIEREKIIQELLSGNAKPAYSILPENSWAYAAGTKYYFDPVKAKKLLSEANLKDKDNDGLLDIKPIIFKISAGDSLIINIAKAIQEDLRQVGLPIIVEPLEFGTLLSQLQKGQYQMTMARWVGGNQNPLFLYDLFASSQIPTETRATRNRSRYSNKKIDDLLTQALNEANDAKAKDLFIKTQEIVSEDIPLLPLWYPSLLILANEKVIGIKATDGADLSFVKDVFKVQ